MGCCLNRPNKKRIQNKVIERSQSINPLAKQQNIKDSSSSKQPKIPQYAKQWMEQPQQSPKKQPELVKQPKHECQTPPPPSKRRQLLRDLFNQAKNKPKQLQPGAQRAITITSNIQHDNSNLKTLQQAIKDVIGRNKQELTSCGICTQQYCEQRAPLMICMSQHTFCSDCVNDIWKKGFKRCPLDQTPFDIKTVQKNRLVLSILEQMPK